MGLNGRLSRLERAGARDVVSIGQLDGTVKRFGADTFWQAIFLAEVAAAVGDTPDAPEAVAVAEALEGATPESLAEVRAMIAADGGDFLQGGRVAHGSGFDRYLSPAPDLSDDPEGPL